MRTGAGMAPAMRGGVSRAPRPSSLLLALAVLAAAACGLQGGPGTSTEDKLSSNGLALRVAELAKLSTQPLSAGGGDTATELALDEVVTGALLASDDGRELLTYVALCALDADTALVTGAGDRFAGHLGLAPQWATERCDPTCQRWISACLLAHGNAMDVPVTISLRGDHPALTWSDELGAAYAFQEAAFYGNVFGGDEAALEMYACAGRDLLSLDGADDASRLLERVDDYFYERLCAVGPCGVVPTGPCYYHHVVSVGTCARDAGLDGGYADCAVAPGVDWSRADPVYPEAITVYLRR
jgi:hypothetical protein